MVYLLYHYFVYNSTGYALILLVLGLSLLLFLPFSSPLTALILRVLAVFRMRRLVLRALVLRVYVVLTLALTVSAFMTATVTTTATALSV